MFVDGLIIVIDLDNFEEYMKQRGWNEYEPNIVTGTLTTLIEAFVNKWRGVVIYGLDHVRGTEEAVIEIPYGHEQLESIRNDLLNIKNEINKLGASISIIVVKDYVCGEPASTRREAYHGTPGRRRALRILRKIKRSGGNKFMIIA